ncbi:hypothetical protein CK936_28555 [Streptomyces albireticuli]|uniref:Uncharacterized protein n=1 Tax=Streptomyces albireticuli TaxID=1940 RepID=A0A2A2D277_9ACTN|nr:hypothetical protein CK936_28555 [Streptomyces albireticuli]
MHEAAQEPGTAVQFHQQRGDRGQRQQLRELLLQRGGLGRDVLRRQRRNDQLPARRQPHLTRARPPVAQHLLQTAHRSRQLLPARLQRRPGIDGFADSWQNFSHCTGVNRYEAGSVYRRDDGT